MIRLEHVEKSFGKFTPLKDVNTVIHPGDVISIIGPSGTGKSTLLRAINLLGAPTKGRVYFKEECVFSDDPNQKITMDKAALRQKIGMVFQSFNLFNHLTVIENIMIPPNDLNGVSKQKAYEEGMRLLKRVGLADKALSYPDELSGGQKQRVAIARTLAMKPEMILFDEPTSALDPTMVGEVEAVISDLAKEGYTIMIVTHDMKFAYTIANRVFYMDDGGIYEDGTPEQIFKHPQREKTKAFIRQLHAFNYHVRNIEFGLEDVSRKILEFSFENQINMELALQLILMVEEIGMHLLMPHLGEQPDVLISIFAEDFGHQCSLAIEYNGEVKNVMEGETDLNWDEINENIDLEEAMSRSIVRETAKEITYEVLSSGDRLNKLKMMITQ